MTLDQLEPQQKARIKYLDPANPNAAHLASLGLIPGQTIVLRRRAPLGDPLHISVMYHELCLRMQDARSVFVESI